MKQMDNQKGFSLVELVVVIAILAIIGTAIYAFFHTSLISYKNTGAEAQMQNQAQLALNQLDNLIIDLTEGVSYTYDTASETGKVITSSDTEITDPTLVTAKTFTIKNTDANYKVKWNKAEGKVYLVKEVGGVDGETSLMADHVSNFQVSLERLDSNKVIGFHFEFTDGDKHFDTNHNITMRNKVTVIGNEVDQYDEIAWYSVTSVDVMYGGVKKNGEAIPVTKTGAVQYVNLSAQVNGINSPPQKVTWSINGASDPGTKVESVGDTGCKVTLGATEDGTHISITAKAQTANVADLANANGITYITMKD